MVDRLSRSQVEKLGRRLAAGPATVEDLEMLEEWRSQHLPAIGAVEGILRGMGLEPTSRLKTTGTIVDKLRRESGMNLARMEDVAGVRVALNMTRRAQDAVVQRIADQFSDAKVRDRRQTPSFGYRAVHVIVSVDGYRVEIQVRTALQNLWAQMQERLADQWGRQMRYGGMPDEPDAMATPDWTRRDVTEVMQTASRYIDVIEKYEAGLEERSALLEELGVAGQHALNEAARLVGETAIDLAAERAEIAAAQEEVTSDRRALDSLLRTLAQTFGVEVP